MSLPEEPPATKSEPSGSWFVNDDVPAVTGPVTRNELYDPGRDREKARAALAYGLMALLTLTVLIVVVATTAGWIAPEAAKELLSVVLAPLVALVGAATGFYYGENGRR